MGKVLLEDSHGDAEYLQHPRCCGVQGWLAQS